MARPETAISRAPSVVRARGLREAAPTAVAQRRPASPAPTSAHGGQHGALQGQRPGLRRGLAFVDRRQDRVREVRHVRRGGDPQGPVEAHQIPGGGTTGLTGRQMVLRLPRLTRLLIAARDRDRRSLRRWVRRTQPEVWRFCASLVDPAAADDLTQEVYLRALAALPAFRGEGSSRTWLLTIARRTCADEIRRRVRSRRLEDPRAPLPGDAPSAGQTGLVDLADLLGGLPDHQREALVLTQVVGLTYAEAAEA